MICAYCGEWHDLNDYYGGKWFECPKYPKQIIWYLQPNELASEMFTSEPGTIEELNWPEYID